MLVIFSNWEGFAPNNYLNSSYHVWFRDQYAKCVERKSQTTYERNNETSFHERITATESSLTQSPLTTRVLSEFVPKKKLPVWILTDEQKDQYYKKISGNYPVRECV
jgi:hypothetical protein